MYSMSDTIFAPLTIKGKCSVYVIRISGSKTFECLKALGIIKKLKHKSVSLCSLKDDKNKPLDEALVLFFKAPHSFTGEDVAELNIHCSSYIIDKVFKILLSVDGVRMAERGEFSKRAFLNGKLDLTQAEAIADLVNSETELQHKQAINQLKGKNSNFFNNLREDIINLSSSIEAGIDFPEDDTTTLNLSLLQEIIEKIKTALDDKNVSSKIKDGVNISIIGEPNVGKSTFLNYLAKKDVAIVSEIAGTTRDIIELSLDIDGVLVNIYDTAGIRETDDIIEKEGVKRALDNAKNADLKLLILSPDSLVINDKIKNLLDDNTIKIINKIDKKNINGYDDFLKISLKNDVGIEKVINKIKDFIAKNVTPYSNTNITQERYRVELKKTLDYLKGIDSNMPVEIIAEKIRSAAFCVGKITGIINTEDILDNIFSKFCIGK